MMMRDHIMGLLVAVLAKDMFCRSFNFSAYFSPYMNLAFIAFFSCYSWMYFLKFWNGPTVCCIRDRRYYSVS